MIRIWDINLLLYLLYRYTTVTRYISVIYIFMHWWIIRCRLTLIFRVLFITLHLLVLLTMFGTIWHLLVLLTMFGTIWHLFAKEINITLIIFIHFHRFLITKWRLSIRCDVIYFCEWRVMALDSILRRQFL